MRIVLALLLWAGIAQAQEVACPNNHYKSEACFIDRTGAAGSVAKADENVLVGAKEEHGPVVVALLTRAQAQELAAHAIGILEAGREAVYRVGSPAGLGLVSFSFSRGRPMFLIVQGEQYAGILFINNEDAYSFARALLRAAR